MQSLMKLHASVLPIAKHRCNATAFGNLSLSIKRPLWSTYPLQPLPPDPCDESIPAMAFSVLCGTSSSEDGGRRYSATSLLGKQSFALATLRAWLMDAPQITALCTAAQDLCVDIPALTHVYERLPTL